MRVLLILGLCFGPWGALFAAQPNPPVPQRIVFWHGYADPARVEYWNAQAEAFNAGRSDIQVESQFYPSYNHLLDAILSGLVTGNLPHAALVRDHHAALFQLGEPNLDWTPLFSDYEALYTNLDALSATERNAPPQTLADLRAHSCDFVAAGGWPRVQSVNPVGLVLPLRPAPFFIWGADDEAALLDMENPTWRERIDFLLGWLADGCIRLGVEGLATAQNDFAAGQTLFLIDSSAAQPYIENAIETFFAEPFALQSTPLPADVGPAALLQPHGVLLFDDAAEAWRDWLIEDAAQAAWTAVNFSCPFQNGSYGGACASRAIQPPRFAGYDLVESEIVFTMRRILSGGDVAAEIDGLATQIGLIRAAFAADLFAE